MSGADAPRSGSQPIGGRSAGAARVSPSPEWMGRTTGARTDCNATTSVGTLAVPAHDEAQQQPPAQQSCPGIGCAGADGVA